MMWNDVHNLMQFYWRFDISKAPIQLYARSWQSEIQSDRFLSTGTPVAWIVRLTMIQLLFCFAKWSILAFWDSFCQNVWEAMICIAKCAIPSSQYSFILGFQNSICPGTILQQIPKFKKINLASISSIKTSLDHIPQSLDQDPML